MQHHARRMRQRECSADASLARDEAAARRDALAQKRAKAALMRREAKAALFRETLGELRLAKAVSAPPRPARTAVARGARRRAEAAGGRRAPRPSCSVADAGGGGAEGVPRSDEAHRGGTSERGRRRRARSRTWTGGKAAKARRTAPSASWTRRRRLVLAGAPELRGKQLIRRLKLDEARDCKGGDFRNSGVQGAF